ncbi:MAG: Basic proline-rich protein precursor [Myxococcales bacterium]|nr:Basic proline-rich protein precursor [Myxococcales bacterium]
MNRLVLVICLVAACGGKAVFRLTSDDNDRAALASALSQRQLAKQPTPTNTAHQPRAFILETGSPKTIVAYDLASSKVLWKTDADVQSRIWVGGDFVVAIESKQLVARDQQKGAVRWKLPVNGEFVGATADADHAYLVWREGTGQHPTWWLGAYDGTSGAQLWKIDAEGSLGSPAAHGGLVYVPFLTQWLSIVDARTGKQLTRLRGIDEQISTVRTTSTDTYFGSKQGVFRLDVRSASGKRSDATYGQVKIPPQLDRTTYGRDVYDAVQSGYTAADRARVLFTTEPSEAGPMKFTGGGYVIHYFRYVFGFGTEGDLTWAYSNPRDELVASDHTGKAIIAVAASGDLVALDPKTGAILEKSKLGTTGRVLGATFDAEGWAPQAQTEKIETISALVAIARDHDARFDKVKELAVSSLAKLPGGDVTKELLAVLSDARAPQKLKDTVVNLLMTRKDPASLPVLTAQLATHSDFLAKTEPESLGAVAKAIAGLAGVKLDPAVVAPALAALQSHLDAPSTQVPDLVLVIDAMAAIGGGAERPALGSHLLLYHADDDLGGDPAWDKAIVVALQNHGGPGERELLRQVAADKRTKPGLSSIIKDAAAE